MTNKRFSINLNIMDVKDLYNIYESINRDIAKLKATQSSIPVDREYTSILLSTINSEIEKFENLKKLILALEIEIPDNFKSIETIKTIEIIDVKKEENSDYTNPSYFPML